MSKTPLMGPIETLTTPTTCLGSDDGQLPQTHERKWSAFRKDGRPPAMNQSQLQKKQLTQDLVSASTKSSDILPGPQNDHKGKERPSQQGRSLLKRAIHKIGKRSRRTPPPAPAVIDLEPPKVEDLGIDPRLLEKWVARKEQKKQQQLVAAGSGHKQVVPTRRAATVVLLGLSAGSVAWLKERASRWRKANGLLLAACIVAMAIGVACTLILRRCA